MADRLAAALDLNAGGLLSLGCGNAAVEAEVVRRGYDVLAIDAMPEARPRTTLRLSGVG
jgi:hypothetical protein